MFIFLGVPLMFCLASVPIVCIILFGSVYTTYFGKAMDLASQPMHTAWVAEAYEPFLLSLTNHQQRAFNIVQEDSILPNDIEVNRMRRQIVGFVSIGPHKGMDNSGWLNRLSIMSKYSFDKVAEPLIQRVLKHGHDQHLDSIEATTTECQFDNRELLLKMGFGMKQIYHKQVLGSNSLRVMKSQLGIDLRTWSVSKNKWHVEIVWICHWTTQFEGVSNVRFQMFKCLCSLSLSLSPINQNFCLSVCVILWTSRCAKICNIIRLSAHIWVKLIMGSN